MKLSFTALGGIAEIGMNCYLYETEHSAILVDCGVKFVDSAISGVEFMIPDIAYLEKARAKLKGVVFTHAHEDHIGAAAFLLERFAIPVVADRYTYDLIEHKLNERKISADVIYFDKEPIELGDFTITAIPISHSIQSTKALYIKLRDGFTILHISDYKIDFSAPSSESFDISHFTKIAETGLGCMVADSTNSVESGFTKSERSIITNLEKIISTARGRVFFTTFSSNTERISTIIDIAKKHDKKVVIEGSSLIKNITAARKHSFIKIDDDIIIQRKHMEQYNDERLIVIASGSQGEGASVISKISNDDYGAIEVRSSDSFIFSSRIIPGNEYKIIKIMNNIAKRGAKIFTDNNHDIHSSGHASAEDIKFMLKLLKPNYLIPVHGENMHLNAHKEIATSGDLLEEDSVLISAVGKKIDFVDGVSLEMTDVAIGRKYVDSFSYELLSSDDILDRMRLVGNGAISIVILVDTNIGNLKHEPIITTVGFKMDDSDKNNLSAHLKHAIDNEIFERMVLSSWEEFVFTIVKRYFKKLYNRRPLITIYVGV